MITPEMTLLIVLLHTFSTLYMTGLIWFVQVVHYPLKSSVGNQAFVDYQIRHMSRTSWVVGPPMIFEAISALMLTVYPPTPISASLTMLGIGLLLFVWISTAVFSVPAHNRLLQGFDEHAYRRLVNTNWLRTIGWSLRGLLSVYFLFLIIEPTLS